MSELRDVPAGSLLDVGCGKGRLGAAAQRSGWRFLGVEPSAAACAVASDAGLTVVCGTLADLVAEPRSFDCIVFNHSLEHTADPLRDLGRAYELLRPGGCLLLAVPNFESWQVGLFGGAWYHLDLPRHRWHFTCRALELMLSRSGFTAVSLGPVTTTLGLAGSLQNVVTRTNVLPSGARRMISAAYSLLYPAAWALDRVLGGGDVLQAIARRPA